MKKQLCILFLCSAFALSFMGAQEADIEAAPDVEIAADIIPEAIPAEDVVPVEDLVPIEEAVPVEDVVAAEKPVNKFAQFFVDVGGAIGHYFTDTEMKTPSKHLEPRRGFSWGSGIGVGLATDLPIGVAQILDVNDNDYKENGKLVFDMDKFSDSVTDKGMNLNFDLGWNFLTIEWNGKNPDKTFRNWGAGFTFLNIDTRFDINIAKDLVTLISEGNGDQHSFDVEIALSGAAFVETLGLNYNQRNLDVGGKKLSFSGTLAHFIPVIYMPRSALSVDLETGDSIIAKLNGSAKAYMAANFEDIGGGLDWGGLDVSASAEYALFPIFDVGVTVTHIPFIPAVLNTEANISFDHTFIDTSNLDGDKTAIDSLSFDTDLSLDITYGDGKKVVVRPMTWDFYALYRPLRSDMLVLRPNIGFTVITPAETGYFNIGLGVDYNPSNWFTVSVYTGGADGIARNSLGLDFHWRAFEAFTRLDMRSQDYWRAWTLKGAAITVGTKIGG